MALLAAYFYFFAYSKFYYIRNHSNKILKRFYDPQKGQVLFDGMDVRELNIRWLRSNFGYVGQEPVLFSGTIFDNITYGESIE
jgi:ABC-type multidrug transport system fused ATPase/permease subunit